jgi:hypothetical protein
LRIVVRKYIIVTIIEVYLNCAQHIKWNTIFLKVSKNSDTNMKTHNIESNLLCMMYIAGFDNEEAYDYVKRPKLIDH